MTTLSDIKVYQGKTGTIIFELERIHQGFAHAKPRQNNVYLKTQQFDCGSFHISMVRDATEKEISEYNVLKEVFLTKEMQLAIPVGDLHRGEIFRLPTETDRYRVLEHFVHKGEHHVRAIKLNGYNNMKVLGAGVKAIKL
jgi:hypothetical protein